jgi:hypothetical protein
MTIDGDKRPPKICVSPPATKALCRANGRCVPNRETEVAPKHATTVHYVGIPLGESDEKISVHHISLPLLGSLVIVETRVSWRRPGNELITRLRCLTRFEGSQIDMIT